MLTKLQALQYLGLLGFLNDFLEICLAVAYFREVQWSSVVRKKQPYKQPFKQLEV